MQKLGFTDVVIELDAKIVVDAFNLDVFPNSKFDVFCGLVRIYFHFLKICRVF